MVTLLNQVNIKISEEGSPKLWSVHCPHPPPPTTNKFLLDHSYQSRVFNKELYLCDVCVFLGGVRTFYTIEGRRDEIQLFHTQ